MTMSNDFNSSGDAIIAYGAQLAGFPKLVSPDGTKTSLTPLYSLTASQPDGSTGAVSIYNIQDGMNVSSDATITNTVGTPDIVKFEFDTARICNHIRVNNISHDLSTAIIEVSADDISWTPISTKNIEEHDTYWDLEFTNNTSYLYYRFTLADLTSIVTSEVDIYLNDRTIKIEPSPDVGNGDDVGEVRFYKAAISGFDGTVTDVDAAGWTQITGTSDLGQSATELAVIDNGLVRVTIDKNEDVDGSITLYAFNGTEWVAGLDSDGSKNDTYEITAVAANSASLVEVAFTYVTGVGTPGATGGLVLRRGLPAVEMYQDGTATGGDDILFHNVTPGTIRTTLYPSSTWNATDFFGYTSTGTSVPTVDNFMVLPAGSQGVTYFAAFNSDEVLSIRRADDNMGFNYESIGGGDVPLRFFLGAIPTAYTTPSTLDAEIGNTDGQLIEAESFYAWEGETPLIGTNLLTNGGFETDLSGWVHATGSGGFARITSKKKFGSACAEVTLAGGETNTFHYTTPALEDGATYALTGWMRTADLTAGFGPDLRIEGGPNPTNSVPGLEWHYLSYIFTGAGTTENVEIVTSGTNVGSFQFDGIQLIKVKDAAGVSALAFDTTSTAGWTPAAGATLSVVDSPRGTGIKVVSTTANGVGATFDVEGQDWTQYRYLAGWVKHEVGGTTPSVSLTDGGVNTGTIGGAPSLALDAWTFVTYDISALSRANVESFDLRISSGTTRTYAPLRLSKHDPAIGQKHGLLHDMGDAEGIAGWWKLGDVATGSELVTNGGFETYTTSPGTPDSWVDTAAGHTIEKETSLVHAGTNALKITAGSTSLEGVRQAVTLTGGKSYYVEAYARTGGSGDIGASLLIRNLTDGASPVNSFTATGETGYTKLSGTFEAIAGKSYQVRLNWLNAPTVGDIVYFDAVTLKEIVATDSSGNTNTGTLRGATNTAGPTIGVSDPFGGSSAMEFDGVDDYITVADDAALDVTGAITMEAWVHPDTAAALQGIVSKIQGTTAIDRKGYELTLTTSTRITVGIGDGVDGYSLTTSGGDFTLGAWNHIVTTIDGSGNAVIYVDGVVNTTGTIGAGTIGAGSQAVNIGARFGASSPFDGRICGVRIYDRALGADEVAQRFNAGTHEAVAGWLPVDISGIAPDSYLSLTTDSVDGTKALFFEREAVGGIGLSYSFASPQNWTPYRYFSYSVKENVINETGVGVTLTDATGATWSSALQDPGPIGSYGSYTFDLSSSTIDMGSIVEYRLSSVGSGGVGAKMSFDGIKLTSLNEVGDWRVISGGSNTSGGYYITTGSAGGVSTADLAAGDKITLPVNIPNAGKYYVGVMTKAQAAGDGEMEVTLNGVASGTPQAITTAAFSSQENQLLFGPFTVPAGEVDLEMELTTLGSADEWWIDFIALYPYERTTSSGTAIFPKDFSNSMLKDVDKLGSS